MKESELKILLREFAKVAEKDLLASTRLPVRVNCVISTESYATMDNSTIQIGLYPWEAKLPRFLIERILLFKKEHEKQHILSTDSTEFVAGIEDVAETFATKGMCRERAEDCGKWLINGLCDGRIENLMVSSRKGLKKLRDWYRLQEYEETVVVAPGMMQITMVELALMQLHSVACRGYLCKGFAKHYKGQPVFDKVIDNIDRVKKAVTASTTRAMANVCREIAEDLLDLIEPTEEAELSKLSEKSEEIVVILSNKNVENLNKGKDWKEKLNKASKIIAILEDTDEESSSENSEDGVVPDEIIDLRTKKPKSDEDTENQNAGKGSSNEKTSQGDAEKSESGSAGDGDEESGDSHGSAEGSECNENASEGSSGGNSQESAEKSKNDDSEGSGEGSRESSSGESSSSDGKSPKSKSVSEFLEEKLSELDESLKKSDELQEQTRKQEVERKIQVIREIQQNGVQERDKNKPDMKQIMLDVEKRQDPYRFPDYRPYDKERWRVVDAPYDIIAKTMPIRQKVKETLASESSQQIGGLYEGDFDVDNISNLVLGSFDCFMKENIHKDEVHFDITVLKDNSGSMGGAINERCCKAMATLEECVKGIPGVSLKMADYSDRKHGIIKDWDEQSGEFSYAWSYYLNEDVDGGQYDDVSMDLFASELVARPSATNKMLLILTDGEPCVPREALNDILTRARQNGVYVFVFFIGYNPEHIIANKDRYEGMYGEGCCIAVPTTDDMDNLADTFVDLLKANVKFD